MKFIDKLKKAISPSIIPTPEEIHDIEEYLKVDWIAELVQQHEEELLFEFSRFASYVDHLTPGPGLSNVFNLLIAELAFKTKRFPTLQKTLEDSEIGNDRVREVLFRLLLSEKIDKGADYLDQIVAVVCARGANYSTKELVLMVEAGYRVYQHVLDMKAQA